MKHAAMTVAVDAVGAVKQKTKMHMLKKSESGGGLLGGGGKATTFQFWRWVILLMITGSTVAAAMWGLLAGWGDVIKLQQGSFPFSQGSLPGILTKPGIVAYNNTEDSREDSQCLGRRVYMYDLPPQFNDDILEKQCAVESQQWLQWCESYINHGFGLKMEGVMDPVEAWYRTEQYALEVILHERFKTYKCITKDPDMADLFFLPYYVGLDVSVYIHSNEPQLKDLLVERFLGWLLAQPAFMKRQGNKHLMALGRVIWDFSRSVEHDGWGNCLLNNYELQNVSKVLIERDVGSTKSNPMAIPYPTSFHPRSDAELQLWQKKVSETKRDNIASFVGGPRNYTLDPRLVLRDILFHQCAESGKCETLVCSWHENAVDCPKNPHFITNVFLSSTFCFQPPGDTPTRKAVFDCLVAGTIPVFFNKASAYQQYLWHLPADGLSYSVYIDDLEVLEGKKNVIEVLEQIPEEKVRQMQKVIHEQIIPSIVYDMPQRDPNKKTKDAFDIVLEHLFNPDYQAYPSLDNGNVQAPAASVIE